MATGLIVTNAENGHDWNSEFSEPALARLLYKNTGSIGYVDVCVVGARLDMLCTFCARERLKIHLKCYSYRCEACDYGNELSAV
jgi:hypothetical protein